MEDVKNNLTQAPNPSGAQTERTGGRRRRKKKKPNSQNGQQNQAVQNNQNNQNKQNQNGQNGQNQNNQPKKNNGKNQNKGQNEKGGNAQKQPSSQQKQQPNPQQKPQEQPKKKKKGNNSSQEENRKDTYAYTLDGNLYINLTNKCSNACDFCVRNERASYYGNYLWLRKGDPTVEKVISAVNGMGDLKKFKEVVFCGFGEPTYKVAEMVALCDYFHEKGIRTRLNTNGQGNLVHKRDITPDLRGKIDFVNISLNASCKEKYQKICRSQFGESGFDGMIEFAKCCKREGIDCRFSIVDCIGEEEVEACKRLASSVNIPLYVRDYITDS